MRRSSRLAAYFGHRGQLLSVLSGLALLVGAQTASATDEQKSPELTGIVLTPDGQPAVGAQVAIANWTVEVQLSKDSLSYVGTAAKSGLKIAVTDATGRFRLPPQHDPEVLVVSHESGYAEADDPRAARPSAAKAPAELRITLQKWGRVVGTVRVGEDPVANAQFRLGSISTKLVRRTALRASHIIETDDKGRFLALRVPPGPGWCQRVVAEPKREGALLKEDEVYLLAWITQFDVPPGAGVKLDLASPGGTITGRLVAPVDSTEKLNWTTAKVWLTPQFEGMKDGMPAFDLASNPMPDSRKNDQYQRLFNAWSELTKGPEGQLRVRTEIPVAADGTFRIENLPLADYALNVGFPDSQAWGVFYLRAAAPAGAKADRPIDVREFQLRANKLWGQRPAGPVEEKPLILEPPDAAAQALAMKCYALQTAVTRLPRFYYLTEHGSGPVLSMPYEPKSTVDSLKKGLNEAVISKPVLREPTTFAWDGKQTLIVYGNDGDAADDIESSHYARAWTQSEAWERWNNPWDGKRFGFPADLDDFGASLSHHSAFFRVTPHQFWWGQMQGVAVGGSDVLPEKADYHSRGSEEFDGELCDIIESTPRYERLWISRKTGLLRGVMQSRFVGPFPPGQHHQLKEIHKLAGRSFVDASDLGRWMLYKATPEQNHQVHLLLAERMKGAMGPYELFCFRDYREVAPGVSIPFREDRVPALHDSELPGFHRYVRVWTIVKDVRFDVELKDKLQRLRPKEGDTIAGDQRFRIPIDYKYLPGRSASDIWRMFEQKWNEKKLADFERLRNFAFLPYVEYPAKPLPRTGWIGGKAPEVAGKPYLLHFWAQWSQASLNDFTAMRKLADEGGIVIGVHPGGITPERVSRVIAEFKLNYPMLIAPANGPEHIDQKVAGYSIAIFPHALIVGADGLVAAEGLLDEALLEKFRVLRGGAKVDDPKPRPKPER